MLEVETELSHLRGAAAAADGCADHRGTHQRCDSCRSAPSAVYCRADAAALCASCDADVHSANPLARRHRRVPVGAAAGPPRAAAGAFVVRPGLNASWPPSEGKVRGEGYDDGDDVEEEGEEEATAWLLLDPVRGGADLLDGGEKESSNGCSSHGKGSEGSQELVVPGEQQQSFQMEMAQEASKHWHDGFGATLGHSVSMSSLEASTMPDCAAPDVTSSYMRPSRSTIDLFSASAAQMAVAVAPQITGSDREARVLRYREKRKARRFEKTIRYASRKAYAETRPRIKGRFAKRSDAELDVDQYFSAAALADAGGYGVVPSV